MTFFNAKLTKSSIANITMDDPSGQGNKSSTRATGADKKIPPRFKNKPTDTVE